MRALCVCVCVCVCVCAGWVNEFVGVGFLCGLFSMLCAFCYEFRGVFIIILLKLRPVLLSVTIHYINNV